MSVQVVLDKLATEAAERASATTTAAPPTAQEPKPEVVKPVEEQPAAKQEEPVQPVEELEPDIESPAEASGDFEKFKPVFDAHPELKSELKQIIGREKAFSELAPNGSFSEAREILTRVPTIEDAEMLAEKAENATLFGEQFRGDPLSFVESLRESDSLAFQQLATQLPEILAESDPRLYQEQARFYANRVMANVLSVAERSNDADFLKAAQMVANYLGVQPGVNSQPAARGDSEASRLRKQLRERDEADAQAEFDTFWQQTDEAIINNCVSEIETTLKKALPNASPAQMKRMVNETWDRTLATMNAQPQTRSQIDSYRNAAMGGRRSIGEHKTIVDFGTRRARLVIPKIAREVITEWSRNIIQASNDAASKKKGIADNSRDAGSGPQATTSSVATNSQTNGSTRRTVNSIFKELDAKVTARV